MKNKISLIGMMGAGKSTIAKGLSEKLDDFELIDLDCEIEKIAQKSITEIFLQDGEKVFRSFETKVINEIIKKEKVILATGGGVFENEENRERLLENSTVIFLDATSEEIFNRIKTATNRPLLGDVFTTKMIDNIYSKRRQNYEKAHFIVDTTGKNEYNIIIEILEQLDD